MSWSRKARRTAVLVAFSGLVGAATGSASPERDSERFAEAVEELNADHAERPGDATEAELVGRLPGSAVAALKRLLAAPPSAEVSDALVRCGEAALDLAAAGAFGKVRERLAGTDPAAALRLGEAEFRDRFVVIGEGEFAPGYLARFADVAGAVFDAYDEVFGFAEWSKVPGKKVRIRVRLVDAVTRPPHFAPQFPYHSEIDFPVADGERLTSPTPQGHMQLYGLCHELGHVIAMWGDRERMEDHHAWAHYTGVVIVEHLAKSPDPEVAGVTGPLRDVRHRSLALERENPDNAVTPSADSKPGVMALLIALHDLVGPAAMGDALNRMDESGDGHRINRVRYYSFEDFERALVRGAGEPALERNISDLF